MSMNEPIAIQVAGDVCLDVVGIPVAPPAANVERPNNWQLTGETRTYYLLGGALLLADFVRAATPAGTNVQATEPWLPADLACGNPSEPLSPEKFLDIAE